MEFIKEKKFILIGVAIGIAVIFYMINNQQKATITSLETLYENSSVLNEITTPESGSSYQNENNLQEMNIMKVDVKGAVKHIGVYEAYDGDRVIDLINRAGGFIDNADVNKVNLSKRVHDEMVIYVPMIGEENIEELAELFDSQQENLKSGKININTADVTMLQTLPGIGQKKAEMIIEYRNTNGPFQKEEDLTNVTGIGIKTFEQLKELITVK